MEPRTTPTMTAEQKQIYANKFAEKQQSQTKTPAPILNLQLYQEPKPPRDKLQPPPLSTFYPMNTFNPYFPPQYSGFMPQYPMPMFPVVKNYHITTQNPTGQHTKISMIYEDVLPTKEISATYTTLEERLTLYGFIRSSILSNSDGHDMTLNMGENMSRSLLSYIKLDDLNPYNTYKYSNNPYKGMPDGFLIYRSCYPIRHNQSSGSAVCAKDSTGVNIRIYKLTEGSFVVGRETRNKFHEFNEWREIAFYEYIRNTITKRKICPNFVNLYGYVIAEKSGIKFDEIDRLRHTIPKVQNETTLTEAERAERRDLMAKHPVNILHNQIIPNQIMPYAVPCDDDNKIRYVNGENRIITANQQDYLGKALIALTESPTYNIFGWASKLHKRTGNVLEMISRGVHTEREWMSVIFQLMVALYVMQIHKIVINNFKLEENVFIKDIQLRGQVTNYWKYIIDGIEYYIPNEGHLVLIDSNYQDQTDQFSSSFAQQNNYKLDGKFIGETKLTDQQIKEKTFEMFTQAISRNNFSRDFITTGGCLPPDSILELLSNMYNEVTGDTNKDIGKYLIKYMTKYMNNRIGSFLKEQEISNIRRDDLGNFKKGQLLVYEDGASEYYKFVLYLSTNNGISTILTKEDPMNNDIIEKQVSVTSLFNYSRTTPITQTFKSNETNMNEEDLLEIYVVSN